MCISTAYKNSESGEVLAEYVASIRLQDNEVIMTDIIGNDTVVEGVLKSADLSKGILVIEQQN